MWIVEVSAGGHGKPVCRSDGKVYEYDTPEDAAKMAVMAYPDQAREDRLAHERKRLRLKNLDTNEYDDVWRYAR